MKTPKPEKGAGSLIVWEGKPLREKRGPQFEKREVPCAARNEEPCARELSLRGKKGRVSAEGGLSLGEKSWTKEGRGEAKAPKNTFKKEIAFMVEKKKGELA